MATAPTTSGTVGTTVFDVTTLIEHGFRRAGKLPSTVSGELLLAAKESLFLFLTSLVSQGVSLWCIKKSVIPLVINQLQYGLPPGATNILGLSYRTDTTLTPASSISGAGYSGQFFASAVIPTNVQIKLAVAATPQLVVEYSNDNITWTQVAAFDYQQSQLPAGTSLAEDIENSASATYWRVRDTSGTLATLSSIVFSNAPSEIPMTAFNRDDYYSLPNKTFQSSRSLQYWFDKQINPVLWLWPVPNTPDQIVAQYQRQIQDIGTFTNTVEAPQRWYEYITCEMAVRCALEMPPAELPQGRLEYLTVMASTQLDIAAAGETDGAPIKIQPNLRGYTR
jgi:hypothetical protein